VEWFMNFPRNVRVSTLALALVCSLPIVARAQSPYLVARGSLLGQLLMWEPDRTMPFSDFGTAADGSPTSPALGRVHVVASGEAWQGTFLNDESILHASAAEARSLRFSEEVFWLNVDETSAVLERFNGGNHALISQAQSFWSPQAGEALGSRSEAPSHGWAPSIGQAETLPRWDADAGAGARGDAPVDDHGTLPPALADLSTPTEYAPRGMTNALSLVQNPLALDVVPTTTVPEPATYLLVSAGLAIIAVIGRRRVR
jgi:hypothetical protein